MAYEVQLPSIPAGIFANPARNIFPQTSINAPAGAALSNAQNQGRVNQVLDVVREQNAMAGPLNEQAFQAQALSDILGEVRPLAQERGAEPFQAVNPVISMMVPGLEIPTGMLQSRSNEARVSGQEADVQKTLSEAAENYAQAASAGQSGTGDDPFKDFQVTFFDTNNPDAPQVRLEGQAAYRYLQSNNDQLAQEVRPGQFVVEGPPPPDMPTGPVTEQPGTGGTEQTGLNLSPEAQARLSQVREQVARGGGEVINEVPQGNGIVLIVRRPNGGVVQVSIDGRGRQQVLDPSAN